MASTCIWEPAAIDIADLTLVPKPAIVGVVLDESGAPLKV
jgi:hypothetical protein